MTDVPSQVKYGEITGFFTTIFADSADPGNVPDQTPLTGTITLTASGATELHWGSTTPPMMTLTKPVLLSVVDGVIQGPSGGRAFVLATTQPDANPGHFLWQATFSFDGVSPQPPSRVFEVPPDGTVDLSQVASVISTPTVQTVLANPQQFIKSVNGVTPDAQGDVFVSTVQGTPVKTADGLPGATYWGVFTAAGAPTAADGLAVGDFGFMLP